MDNNVSENRIVPFDDMEHTQEKLEEYLEKIRTITALLRSGLTSSEEGREIYERFENLYDKILLKLGRKPDDPLEQVTIISDLIKDVRKYARDAFTADLAEELNKVADGYLDQENDIMDEWAERVKL